MDSTFTPLYDLFSLTEAQRAEYIKALNEHMRLDPRLNLIRLTKMDSDSGSRLVPYIGKGGTDILRDTWGIDVIDMIQHDGPGYVSFTAVGKNPKGRVDRAVGAAATEGLRGTKIADMICTAQTKASRRLTLQFVGGGVLDESEVPSTAQMTELPSSGAQLAGSPVVLPPPAMVPAVAPGKDITPEPEPPTPMETLEKLEVQSVQSPKEAEVLAGVENPLNMGMTGSGIVDTPPESKKRGRRRRNTVVIESPGQTTPVREPEEPAKCLDCGQALKDHEYFQGQGYLCKVSLVPPAAEAALPPQAKAQPETLAAPQIFVSPTADIPQSQLTAAPNISSDKLKDYRERLKVYANDVLPKQGGMMPSEGYGGVTMKLRSFAQLQVGAGSVAAFTIEQWEMLFEFLDGHLKQFGAKELVAYIDKAIGATK